MAELGHAVADDEEIISWRYGRCLPYGDGVTFWALGEVVKAQAGIHENDSAPEARGEARPRGRRPAPRGGAGAGSASSLEPLVGLGPEDVGLRDRRSELFAGWRIFLERLAERRPLVLVIDDLQWADDGLLDFVEGLVDLIEGVPMLVVCCSRPELLERRPGWGGGKRNAITISLGAAVVRRHRATRRVASRPRPGGRGAPRVGRRAGGGQSALRGGVRPHARLRRAVSRRCPTACSGSSPPASTCCPPQRRSFSATRP